jgi:4'-phosphopantetheinyl transferase EntD
MADVLFERTTAHGCCVGVALPEELAALDAMAAPWLHAEEREYAATLGEVRRRTWIGGRVALRRALALAGLAAPAVLPDDRGAPLLPPGVAASVSHKAHVAVALVAAEEHAKLGVDVELEAPRVHDISARVLRPEELAELGALSDADREREVILRFSAKESVYKALDPFVRRYVGFHEVAVHLRGDGTGGVTPFLAHGEGPFAFDLRWEREGALILTSARVTAR